MLTREQRVKSSAMWLERWKAWQASGVSIAKYAQREGFEIDAVYRWKRLLKRDGQWVDAPVTRRVKRKKPQPVVRFARVAVMEMPMAPMLLRLMLANGRRAELQIGASQLSEVVSALERTV